MKLLQIYECLCDETRLRILHLLSVTPLCVSHLQKILNLTQVKISKHLIYMKERQMVTAVRLQNKMVYSLNQDTSPELEKNMRCLQDCSKEYPIFKKDLEELQTILNQVTEIKEKIKLRSV
jgi:ArsR family transcriptional regulator